MPGHKGAEFLGMEQLDITEIDGADSLYEANGIIRQSEETASGLFGSHAYYSTEGSSHCIRAMLYLATLHAKHRKRKPLIAAARNVHKAFLSAAALLDLDVIWLYSEKNDSYLSCELSAEQLDSFLQAAPEKPAAVYLTSPDYLGTLADVAGIARICRKHGILLLVDNAHGAYLKFLDNPMHPMDLGADMCCDSAHKTLPVLTGGAYLHISPAAPEMLAQQAKSALALFGSTSPSYLILQSLDAANAYLREYPGKLWDFLPQVQELKDRLYAQGYCLYGDEPLKITIQAKPYGYSGKELAQLLQDEDIICEFSDPDYLVLMLTPEIGAQGLQRLERAILAIPRRAPVQDLPPEFQKREKCLSIREALLGASEVIPISKSNGRILADASVGCPPAVPVLICGERIDSNSISCLRYYGIHTCSVIPELP